jgi:hypothetical protein
MSRYPGGLPRRYRRLWRKPWARRGRFSPRYRHWLDRHGYITPHFRWSEAACKDGTHVPPSLRRNAIRHGWNLERFRHRLGDRPLRIISWYRHPAYNRKIGGASKSRHMSADATDYPREFVNAVGRNRFFREADVVFRNGGVGNYPAGSAHTDSRGWRSRWRSF